MEFLLLTKTGGILGPFASVLGIIMDWLFKFTSYFGIMNIGLCIILFTLVTKLLMFPLTIKQQKSTKLMSVMQPEMNAIQQKYKGKKDQESLMKQNVEMQALYEKYGTSMTGGCIQLVIQMPILFALYRVIYNIPAYVTSVRTVFDNVVTSITANYGSTYVQQLTDFANANKIIVQGGLDNLASSTDKFVDLLYKFNPSQWQALEEMFPKVQDMIHSNAAAIEGMNSFLGINLSTTPFQGFVPNAAWLIPVLAGVSQWLSAKLMTTNQPSAGGDGNNTMASSMKMMNTFMPLMSVFICFTLPAGVGIYWIASSVFMVIQQLIVNSYMNKIDIDEMVKKNMEKANIKRAKKGLPPAKVTQNATSSLKNIQAENEKEEALRAEKVAKTQEKVKESTSYYNQNAKPGSLAAKANMVQKYNEKHNK